MIVSEPFAFQVRSLQGLVKLENELARQTACGENKIGSLNRKSFLFAQVEILRIQMLSLYNKIICI